MNRSINLEKHTLRVMMGLYCSKVHRRRTLCEDCSNLLGYSLTRIDHCSFYFNKPTCKVCPVHCYKPEMCEKIKQVMRVAGPKMVLRHPFLAIHHLINKK